MDSRLWFEILRFYFRIILWGDPVEPRAKSKQRSKAELLARLEPVTQTE